VEPSSAVIMAQNDVPNTSYKTTSWMEGQGMRLPLHGLPVPGSIPNLDLSAETGMGMRSGIRGALHQDLPWPVFSRSGMTQEH